MIDVKSLTKTYETYSRGHGAIEVMKSLFRRQLKKINAVNNISFTIDKGEILAFLGPNGAGKSTTLKMLSGILHPTSGEIKSLGLIPWKNRKVYVRRIGAVFGQKSQLIWDIPPIDAFYMNKAIYNINDEEYKRTLAELTQLLDVEEIMKKPTRQLSLGERMKCEFIMAMLHKPELVFLDEPTIGLDMIAKQNIRSFIRKMNEQGVTFILTTHDLEDVERLANRVIVINHGEIIVDDSLEGLRSRLGTKKAVKLKTELSVTQQLPTGVKLISQKNSTEVELEVDVDILALKPFIAYMNESFGIIDMTIEALPIEVIMKQLYETPVAVNEVEAGI